MKTCPNCNESYSTNTKTCLVCIIRGNPDIFTQVFADMDKRDSKPTRGRPRKDKYNPDLEFERWN